MGQSLGTKIIYGFKIHDMDSGWPFPTDPDTYGHVWPDWVKLEDEVPEDMGSQIIDRIVSVFANFHEPEPEYTKRGGPEERAWDAWYEKRKAAKASAQVDDGNSEHLDTHYSGVTDYMDTYLGFELFDGDYATLIEPKAIGEHIYQGVTSKGWDDILARATEALNFQAVDSFDLKPQVFLLATYW